MFRAVIRFRGLANKRSAGVRLFSSTSKNGRALDAFGPRHLGPKAADQKLMLKAIGFESIEALVDSIVPEEIRGGKKELEGVPSPATEYEATNELKSLAKKNKVLNSMIGLGYYGTKTPAPILRNIISNPAWYTAYTPYQAEISQGRLEMLLNFQTMVSSLTSLEIANCSLLDEGSAAAEAMNMCYGESRQKKKTFFVAEDCHPQTIASVQTRAESMGINVVVGPADSLLSDDLSGVCGALVQYPNTSGSLDGNYQQVADALHKEKARFVVATDLLACTTVTPPGEFGADIVVGSAQRFGVPMFYGGPHAGFMSTKDELKRLMPGRLIGVSEDSQGNRALRMALQTREQFIKREKATSNICTAQALLANVAAAYSLYHGPEGLKKIAQSVHSTTVGIVRAAEVLGLESLHKDNYFDTCVFLTKDADAIVAAACKEGINLRVVSNDRFGLSVDETTDAEIVSRLLKAIASATGQEANLEGAISAFHAAANESCIKSPRESEFMPHPVFHKYHSETELLRYLSSLERRDITLRESMIPLGSCTMKLNAASELLPVT